MLGCPSPKKSFKSSDNAHRIVGDLGEVSCVVRKGAESFQARVEEPLGSDSYQTISERSGGCWLQIGLKKCFVLLCPIGEQQRLFWDVFLFSNSTAIVSPYLSGALIKVVHARGGGGGALPCISHTGMCRPKGLGFCAVSVRKRV